METRYVVQAGLGQAELWSLGRPVDEVIDDPETSQRTRVLLLESKRILAFAKERGFSGKGNYEEYVELDRGQVVWFMAASQPLQFQAEVWSFPLVGSFPYLGWFDKREAREIFERLEKRGLDVYLRPVRAYSTGGWLDDPILSTMLSNGDDAFRYLANVLLHELTHANLFVEDQATFNESLASFVGDTMADEYLQERFGEASEEVQIYRREAEEGEIRAKRFVALYQELDALYKSNKSDAQKRAQKQRLTEKARIELGLVTRPNNAALLGFKVYNTGKAAFVTTFAQCGKSWNRFFREVRRLNAKDFGKSQLEEIDPVVVLLGERCEERIAAMEPGKTSLPTRRRSSTRPKQGRVLCSLSWPAAALAGGNPVR